MDADLSMMALWERATRAFEAVKKGIDECTETLLGTLQIGERLAVHIEMTQVDAETLRPTIIFQILAPGDAPQSGFEWTVYGPKV